MEYPKMDPELKQKWIKALRSGDYYQGEGMLYNPDGSAKPRMCCLGVLEHICGTPLEEMEGTDICFSQDLLNPKSPEEFHDGTPHETIAYQLALMNDGNAGKKIKQHSFEEISNFIEENL